MRGERNEARTDQDCQVSSLKDNRLEATRAVLGGVDIRSGNLRSLGKEASSAVKLLRFRDR